MKEKRFVEDYNEPDEDQDNEIFEKSDLKKPELELEDEFEEEIEDDEFEEPNNIFNNNSSSFSPRRAISGASPLLESEQPVQNLERDLALEGETKKENQQTEQPIMYNAPQYSGSYNSNGYEAVRQAEPIDITGGAATAVAGREINMKRWQETAMGYPGQRGGAQQGENYIRTPEKQREDNSLPFQRGNQRRNIGWNP